MKDTVLLEISNHALVFSLIDVEVSSTFRLPLLLRCSSISFFVNTGKLSRDLQHGTSFEVFTVGFSALSAIFDCCPPEPRFHDFARVFVTNAGKVYSVEFTYSNFSCHLKVNRDKLALINRLWKCEKGERLTITAIPFRKTD